MGRYPQQNFTVTVLHSSSKTNPGQVSHACFSVLQLHWASGSPTALLTDNSFRSHTRCPSAEGSFPVPTRYGDDTCVLYLVLNNVVIRGPSGNAGFSRTSCPGSGNMAPIIQISPSTCTNDIASEISKPTQSMLYFPITPQIR